MSQSIIYSHTPSSSCCVLISFYIKVRTVYILVNANIAAQHNKKKWQKTLC